MPPDKARHAVSVMRYKEGDELAVIDGLGCSYLAKISSIQKNKVLIDILAETEVDAESPADYILCQGILKGDKMDLVIQKATELGVGAIIPLITARSQVRETRKMVRWRKIAEEASEQCGRAVVPKIGSPVLFDDFLKNTIPSGPAHGIIFWEKGGFPVDSALDKAGLSAMHSDSLYLIVGPEGGFEGQEVEAAESRGFIKASLGRRILRADTAAVAALSLVHFLAENNKMADKV